MSDLDKELKHLHCELKALRRKLANSYDRALRDRYTVLLTEVGRLETIKAHRDFEHQEPR